MSREFTREEMLEIAWRCGVPVCQASIDNPIPHIWETLNDNLFYVDGVDDPWPWADNAQTAAVVIRKYLRKFDCFLMMGADGFNMVGRDINLDYNYKWYASWTTAVLEAVLMVREWPKGASHA